MPANPAQAAFTLTRLPSLHKGVGPAHARRILARLTGAGPAQQCLGMRRGRRRFAPGLPSTATLSRLAAAAGGPSPVPAAAILAVLAALIRARYPDTSARLADLEQLADAAAAQPSLHDALAGLSPEPARPGIAPGPGRRALDGTP